MESKYYPQLNETLYHQKLDNGLDVYLLPKHGFTKSYGLFTTNYGSIDTSFVPYNQDKMITTVDGIAHFLEHKMFDFKGGDAMDSFAKLGATTNAFTSSNRTAYLFSTTQNELACIDLLLDFVQELSISDKSVEKEKGIIAQEILMYDDDPDWRVYFGSIENLYHVHPVARDIAGTVDDVNSITKEMLEVCYNTFYHPSNMMLFVVGNIDPQEAMNHIISNQAGKSFLPNKDIKLAKIDEPTCVKLKENVLEMDVDLNRTIISIKINDLLDNPIEKIKRNLSFALFFDLFFAKSSRLYNEWLEKGIINDSFSCAYTQERDYSFIQIACDIDNYQLFIDTVKSFISNIDSLKINENDFGRVKRKNIGNLISLYNSPESIANMFSRYYFDGIISLEIIDILVNLDVEEINNIFKFFNLDLTTTFVVKSKE